MKKIILLLVFALAVYCVNAQESRTPRNIQMKKNSGIIDKNVKLGIQPVKSFNDGAERVINPTTANVKANQINFSKNGGPLQAPGNVINESFETFPPTGWSFFPEQGLRPTSTGYGLIPTWCAPRQYYEEIPAIEGDNSYALFLATLLVDMSDYGYPNEASLYTLPLEPTEADNTLTYRVIEVYDGNADFIDVGAELYVEISTDYGTTWTTSTDNILLQIPNHNEAGDHHFEDFSLDLSEHIGNAVMVRFRAVSDFGGFNIAIDQVAGVPEVVYLTPELEVAETIIDDNLYTPLRHAQDMISIALVINNGTDMESTASLNFSVTPGEYSQDLTISALEEMAYEILKVEEGNGFTPTETGEYTLTASTDFVDDNSYNNSTTAIFNITKNTFATDDQLTSNYVVGTGDDTGAVGNVFNLLENDVVSSFTVTFGSTSQSGMPDMDFTLCIYSVDPETNAITEIYTSGNFTRTIDMDGEAITFEIEPQYLTAGLYFFGVNQLTAGASIQVLTDENPNGVYHYFFTGENAISYSAGYGNMYVRVNTSQVIGVTPEDGSEDVALDALVKLTLVDNITEGDFSGITIVDNGNNTVSNINVTFENNELTIAHDDFDYETEYTVKVPVTAIDGLWEEITWSFTTLADPSIVTPEISSRTPEENATDVLVDAEVSITFDIDITATNLNTVTVTPNPGQVVATTNGPKLMIAHDDFAMNTEYTVTIPAGVVEGYDGAITWSFRTGGVGFDNELVNQISIYPNPSNGDVNIIVTENSFVEVIDMTGKVISGFNVNANEVVNFNQPAGIYMVKVESKGKISTHKLVIQ